ETSKKEKIINDQKLSLTRRQTMLTVFGAAIVLLSLLALFAILRFRLKQKAAAELAVKNERIETLIRELQHRVKNNMQLISSLLSLQGSSLQDTKARAAVQEGQMRIEAMSLIHRKLYLKNDISEVNIRDYLETLVQNLVAAYRPHPDQVRLVLESDNINLAVDTAVPLGLITNELVTNALKYGMSAPEPLLTVRLRLSREGLCKLTVADNGLGAHTPDAASGGLGMKLVMVLAAQIHASVSIRNEAGLIVDITQSSL
ncbi:MAG: sensor histidine kinase, partial [Chitinophagaceae bacterium]|nr:sensor histidine kinase [Chitinophagaceae bacterium]